MNYLKYTRAGLSVAALTIVALSQAQISLFSVSNGTVATTPPGFATANETVDFMAGGYGALATDMWQINLTPVAGNFVGTATYSGVGDSLTIALSLPNANGVSFNSSNSIDGSWTYVSGTGGYANKAGNGTLAINLIDIKGTLMTGTTLSGTLNAVPEPAPFAAVGLGALGLLIRRRKS